MHGPADRRITIPGERPGVDRGDPRLRSRIYAWSGYSSSTPEGQACFSTVSWYRPDPAYSEARLSRAAKRNIAFLQKAKAEKRACMD